MRITSCLPRVGASALAALVMVATSVSPAGALDLSWLNFPNRPGSVQSVDLACDQPDSAYRLFATFRPPQVIPDVVAYVVEIELVSPFQGCIPLGPLAAFWHFESGGCNAGMMFVDATMPPGGSGIVNPWAFAGGAAVYPSYAPDFGVGRGLLRIEIRCGTPVSLTAGTEYFAFTAGFLTCLAGVCDGCRADYALAYWGSGYWERKDGARVFDQGQGAACFNNGCAIVDCWPLGAESRGMTSEHAFTPVPEGGGVCDPTPVRDRSWGALKIRYR